MSDNRVAITQPNFMPWIGYFEMIDRVDVFVYLDDVQFPTSRKDWINRNRIRSAKNQGWEWITASVEHKGEPSKLICNTKIAGGNDWKNNIKRKVELRYSGYAYFEAYWPDIWAILNGGYKTIAELNISLIEHIIKLLRIDTVTLKSSDLKVVGRKDDKLLNIVKKVGGNFYLANNGSKSYIRQELFASNGIDFEFQDFVVPEYKEYLPDAVPPLTILDLLFIEGAERSVEIIRGGVPQRIKTV